MTSITTLFFFFSSRRRHTRCSRDWSSDVCSSDLIADQAREYREKLVEAAAETDDELLSKYLESGSLEEPEMLKALRAGITTGKIIPVLCAAAVKGIGTQALLDLIVHEFPSPADRAEVVGTDLKAKQAGPPRA